MKESFIEEVNGKFRRKLSESTLADSTKQSYLKRMNVLAHELKNREITHRSQMSITHVRAIFDQLKNEGYTRNHISAMITAFRKFDNYYTKSNMRISTVLREDYKHIFNFKKEPRDVDVTAAESLKKGIPPQKYMPELFKSRLDENIKSSSSKTHSDKDFKLSYEFLKHTGLRSGAFFGTKSVNSDAYLGIMKSQVTMNKDGSATIKAIKDKYAREGWTMELPKGHPAIVPLQKLMKQSGDKLSRLDQKSFERRFTKVVHEVRRDPDIVENHGNLPNYTPHSLRATFIHDQVHQLISKGISTTEAYEKVAELVNHSNTKTTKRYDV